MEDRCGSWLAIPVHPHSKKATEFSARDRSVWDDVVVWSTLQISRRYDIPVKGAIIIPTENMRKPNHRNDFNFGISVHPLQR